MAIATLDAIIKKVRKLTGSGTNYQLTDAQIIDYINSFYLYDFPAQFRSMKLKDKYTFNTQRGIDTYPFDYLHWSTVEMPCYCAKREIKLFQDPWSFYGVWFNWQQFVNFAQGDGTDGTGGSYDASSLPYTPLIRSANNNPRVQTTLTQTSNFLQNPTIPSFPQANIGRVQNILITANVSYGSTLNVTDDGAGNLIGDCVSGTIDYETGQIANLVFTAAIPSGNTIQIQYNPTQPSIPLAILFYQNQFTLRPVPNTGYTIELVAYRLPSQILLGTTNPDSPNYGGVPEIQEWWETIAAGAAKKVFEDRLDSDGIALMDKMLFEHYALNEVRTYAQLGKQSIATIYKDQLNMNYGSGGYGSGGTGGT